MLSNRHLVRQLPTADHPQTSVDRQPPNRVPGENPCTVRTLRTTFKLLPPWNDPQTNPLQTPSDPGHLKNPSATQLVPISPYCKTAKQKTTAVV